jgi:putative solute:sodium symporter small subunit
MDNAAMPEDRHRLLWRRTRRVTALLLAVWLSANLAGPWLARPLNGVHLAGLPLGYWLAAQGFLLLYLVIIVAYVVWMNRLEARFHDQLPSAPDSRAPE